MTIEITKEEKLYAYTVYTSTITDGDYKGLSVIGESVGKSIKKLGKQIRKKERERLPEL